MKPKATHTTVPKYPQYCKCGGNHRPEHCNINSKHYQELLDAAKNFVYGANHIVLAHRERLLKAIAKAQGDANG